MKFGNHHRLGTATGVLLFLVVTAVAQAQPPEPVGARLSASDEGALSDDRPVTDDLPGPEILQQGPLHEAFAKPLALEHQSVVIDRQPPPAVNELAPELRPDGPNVNWLPGYWFFDEQRADFVWVSGMWRNFPPGRSWVPGEWQEIPEGYQWVAGFWANAQGEQQAMLPLPPDTLELGPSSPAPGDDFLWTPGCWQWGGGDYAWQPGFWYAGQPDWVWVPNHYCYTRSGAIYVSGYWDYPLARRGLVYAPVFWGAGYHFSGAVAYRPRSIINTGLLIAHLFVDSRHGRYHYGHYGYHGQFGDHAGHLPSGLVAWNHGSQGRWGDYQGKSKLHDPLFTHFQWQGHRHGAHGQNVVAAGNRGFDKAKEVPLIQTVNRLSVAERETLKLRRNNTADLANFRQQAEKYRVFDRQNPALVQSRAGVPIDRGRSASGTVRDGARKQTRVPQEIEAARRATDVSPQRAMATRTAQPMTTRTAQPMTTRTAQPMTTRTAQPSLNSYLRSNVRSPLSQRLAKPATSGRSGTISGTSRVPQNFRLHRGQAVQRQQQAQPQFRGSSGHGGQQKTGRGGGKGPNR